MIINKFFKSNQFVFDLFLEGKIASLYTSKVSNALTKKTIHTINSFGITPIKRVFIAKDIPEYLNIKLNNQNTLKARKVNQYKGYLVNLLNYATVEDYLKENLSRRNRKNLFSKQRKLERNHKITNKVYFGNIDKSSFESIFNSFYDLLKKRFQEKKAHNRYLASWESLKTLAYKSILEKDASLHIIFDNGTPITITLNFHRSDVVFSHIQTYDTNYTSYNMGDISMLNHLKWCFENGISIFDLAIGKSDYKDKWCNYEYDFFYHIHYNNKSVISKIIAKIVFWELKILKSLRDRNIIGNLINFDKILYLIKKC
ncbi:GNAT family N-acetyltransferase [Flavivirga aquimarina]|uniref:GNAT family N-acetyltransferase n=1 Tax=Flavivirga aquimarina TaxID=2027862 RepID=A0ABT8WDJ7_9FLAO|nr:GNAT family N-acetyltransferase [Flavivirga aquimarina]MDO5971138.1 GNAT family N-acetyltransferase [Flavivirga aquimarina]